MLILGWHGNPQLLESDDWPTFTYHDSAAVILRDGALIAAVEEERLNRVKHASFFPARAIRFCLAQSGATIDDVDIIVTDSDEDTYDFVLSRDASNDIRAPFRSSRQLLIATFAQEFDKDVSGKLRFCKHHVAHLSSSWYASDFQDALAVCIDGDGDGASGLIAHCSGERIRTLRHLPEDLSLGNFYLHLLFFLGYQRFDEYKAMGLAPYGDANVYEPVFSKLYQLLPEGRYSLLPPLDRLLVLRDAGLFPLARRKGDPFTQRHKDFAAGLQVTLERIVEHITRHFQQLTGARRLCLSGGVAHNCTMNGKLLRSGRFEQLYVQPAAHDAGNALGAALAEFRATGLPIQRKLMPHLFLGPDVGTHDEIGRRLLDWKPLIHFEPVTDAPGEAAALLARGEVIGWVQGRSEFGPRALGNRSILADPRPAENKRIINEMVKKREDYRPFAPAVTQERLHDYFDVPATTAALPFMIVVVPVRPEMRKLLGAITHVDGSARVQSVSRTDNALFHALIESFGRLTGVPIVLNTSFNNNAEPIVDSIDDAVTAFLTTGLHALVIGDWLVRKSAEPLLRTAVLDLAPEVSVGRRLVRRAGRTGSWLGIECSVGRFTGEPPRKVSCEVFSLLTPERPTSILTRCHEIGLSGDAQLGRIGTEIFDLWTARAIRLLPVCAPGR
jgi:carbamoyltransferase